MEKTYTSKEIDKALNKWSNIQAEAAKLRLKPWKYVEYFGITDELVIKFAKDMKNNRT